MGSDEFECFGQSLIPDRLAFECLKMTDNLDYSARMQSKAKMLTTINSKTIEQDDSPILRKSVEKCSPEKYRSAPLILIVLCRGKEKLLLVRKRLYLNINLLAQRKEYITWNLQLIQF